MPGTWARGSFYFEKVADRAAWDFALLSISAALKVEGETVRDARLVAGGAAWVLTAVLWGFAFWKLAASRNAS